MPILAALDKDVLLAAGLVGPLTSKGTLRIHKRRLNRSSDEEYAHIPLAPVSATGADNDEAFVEIPDHLVSLASLGHIGYNEETGLQVWTAWNNWPSSAPARETDDPIGGMPFIDFAVGQLNQHRDLDTYEDDDQPWHHCLNVCGVTDDLHKAIMDPVFKRVRQTESCMFWIVDTMTMRYRGLEEIQKASREREASLQRARTRPRILTSGTVDEGSSSRSSEMTVGSNGGGRRSVSATQRLAPGIERDTAMSLAALSASNAPGYTILYKGIDKARIQGIHDSNGDVVEISKLLSAAPNDFFRAEDAYYFAVDREVAVYYASYAKHRNRVSSVVIVHMAIPNSAIETLSENELLRTYWPDTEWKNLIFHCRNRKRLPSELRKFKQATLIIGNIATKPNSFYWGLDSPDQITERMLLKTRDGHSAIQYVFSNEEGEQFLEDHGQLKVYPLTVTESMDWYEDH